MISRIRNALSARRERLAKGRTMSVLRDAAADAQRTSLPQMAAALSYRTIFGLIPVLVVGLVLIRSFTTPEAQAQVIKDVMSYTGLTKIAVRPVDAAPPPASAPESGEDPASPEDLVGPPMPDFLTGALQAEAPQIDEWVNALVQRAETSVKFGAIGLIGLLILIYAAVAMLVEIERAFNQIFRVPRGRSWVGRMVNYWALLTLGAIGLGATFWVSAKFRDWATHFLRVSDVWIGSSDFTLLALGFVISVVISMILLTVVYETLPNTRVKALPAMCGALIAAVLWEAGKWGFALYVSYSTNYARLYGSLALVPMFLLWVYYTWLIVLFGLQVTYQLQYGRNKKIPQPIGDGAQVLAEPSAALVVMTALAKALRQGKPMTAPQVATATGLSEGVVGLVLSAMTERGLAHRVERPDAKVGEASYAIAVEPSTLPAEKVLEIGFELSNPVAGAPPETAAMIERLRLAQLLSARGQTLGTLAGIPRASGESAPVEPASRPQTA